MRSYYHRKAAPFTPFRFAVSWGWLRAPAFALVLVLSPFTAGFAHAAPPVRAHVFFVRGFLNIFSLGLDEMAAKLRRQGIDASVDNHLLWALIADEAAAEYKSGRINTIILVGHSSGATALPDMIARLSREGVPVKLAIGLDSIFHTSLSGRVGKYINYYVADGAGTRVRETSSFHGTLENVDVDTIPGMGHLTIDKNPIIQQRVIAAIDAAVHMRPSNRIAKRKLHVMPVAASHALGAKRAAVAN
jgi:hypothetical protein